VTTPNNDNSALETGMSQSEVDPMTILNEIILDSGSGRKRSVRLEGCGHPLWEEDDDEE
jgi:hypothetical protein